MPKEPAQAVRNDQKRSWFRLGLFGDTRSGKTMYLTALYDITDRGELPPSVNIKPTPGASLGYLNGRVAIIRSGQWPPGTIDINPVDLVIEYRRRTYDLHTKDFKGGDFPSLADPKDKAEFNRFVAELFDGCSVYVFLVDPGVLKLARQSSTTSKSALQKKEALRVTTALAAAMEQTRCTGRVSHLFHRPIAIVFTKCDLHPDVMADPEGFAAIYLEPVRRHLRDHAPKRHRFFAVSSTGPLADGAVEPPIPLKPQRLVEPLTWCIEEHCKRWKVVKVTSIAALAVLFVAVWLWLYFNHHRQIDDIRSQISTSADGDLASLFRRATSLNRSVWTLPTHPFETERLRQEIASEAHRRMDEDIAKHVDASDVLRDLAFYDDFDSKVNDFGQSYPGTADAEDLRIWLRSQRRQLAERVVKRLESLAADANETAFDAMLKEYTRRIALPELEDRVNAATDELNRRVNRTLVSLLREQRLTRPREIDVIRETLQKIEEDIKKRRLRESAPQVKYVRIMRRVYDNLKKRGSEREIHCELRSGSSRSWEWDVTQNKAILFSSGGFFKPAPDPNPTRAGLFLRTSPKFKVCLFSNEPLTVRIEESTWGPNGVASQDGRLSELPFGRNRKVVTNEGTEIRVHWHDDGEIADHFAEMRKIEELEEELFRAEEPQ